MRAAAIPVLLRTAAMKITRIETHVCHACMRNLIFVKVLTAQDGLFGGRVADCPELIHSGDTLPRSPIFQSPQTTASTPQPANGYPNPMPGLREQGRKVSLRPLHANAG